MANKPIEEYLTFDDVMLLPAYSKVLPINVSIETRLTRKIRLNSPLVSAPMDTVTSSNLAIALAQEGGIGIIHKNFPPKIQASQVEKVKRYSSGMILDPITLTPKQKIQDALDVMQKYNISGIPVIDGDKLVGIISNRDLRFETNMDLFVDDLMTKEDLVTTPLGTSMDEAKELLQKHRKEKLLVVDDKGKLKGLITVKDIEKSITYPNALKDERGRLLVGAAVGVGEGGDIRIDALVKAGADVLVVDTAHGHSEGVVRTIEKIKKKYGDLQVIAGNVATPDGTRSLIDAGADAVKVGIGPGSICTTRIISGVGVPQISAVTKCAEEANRDGVPVISDGGIKYSGDIVKAIAAGASSVMIGSIFAGTDESPGEKILYHGRTYKEYRGMGSIGAMEQGSSDRYFQEGESSSNKLVPEGVEARIPYKGGVSQVVFQLIGGLRSGMGYCGCETVKELQEKTKFIRITSAGLKESHVHDVDITKEAPNYGIE